jgi:hypothetical protein
LKEEGGLGIRYENEKRNVEATGKSTSFGILSDGERRTRMVAWCPP